MNGMMGRVVNGLFCWQIFNPTILPRFL